MKTCCCFKPRYLILKTGHIISRAVKKIFGAITMLYFSYNAINPFFIWMKFVETEIVTGDKINNDTGAYTQCEPKYINSSVHFMAADIAPGDYEIVFYHT